MLTQCSDRLQAIIVRKENRYLFLGPKAYRNSGCRIRAFRMPFFFVCRHWPWIMQTWSGEGEIASSLAELLQGTRSDCAPRHELHAIY